MLEAESYELSPSADEALREYLQLRMRRPRFAHARSVRNGLERARLRHANRIYEAARQGHAPTLAELVTIEAQDIRASRVFGSDGQTDVGTEAA
jgi:AAA lid domain